MTVRNIVFIALSEERIDNMQAIEGMYELTTNSQENFKWWFGHVRDEHSDFIITTTTELATVAQSHHNRLSAFEGETLVKARDVERLNCREIPNG